MQVEKIQTACVITMLAILTAYFILKLSICINTVCNSQVRSTGSGSDLVDTSLMEPTATDSVAVMAAPSCDGMRLSVCDREHVIFL